MWLMTITLATWNVALFVRTFLSSPSRSEMCHRLFPPDIFNMFCDRYSRPVPVNNRIIIWFISYSQLLLPPECRKLTHTKSYWNPFVHAAMYSVITAKIVCTAKKFAVVASMLECEKKHLYIRIIQCPEITSDALSRCLMKLLFYAVCNSDKLLNEHCNYTVWLYMSVDCKEYTYYIATWCLVCTVQ